MQELIRVSLFAGADRGVIYRADCLQKLIG